jgi:deazaflavin-dependent oxidoreductase (nitroreductase family)
MPLEGEYAPSPEQGIRNQVEQIESSGGTAGMTTKGMPVVVITMRGAKTGMLRKVPVMRVEHDGAYAAVASLGGAPRNPAWYHNLVANPRVELQDGAVRREFTAREVHGAEKERWWERCVATFPEYADLQANTARQIPVFVLE